jgi:hypothetical protein
MKSNIYLAWKFDDIKDQDTLEQDTRGYLKNTMVNWMNGNRILYSKIKPDSF